MAAKDTVELDLSALRSWLKDAGVPFDMIISDEVLGYVDIKRSYFTKAGHSAETFAKSVSDAVKSHGEFKVTGTDEYIGWPKKSFQTARLTPPKVNEDFQWPKDFMAKEGVVVAEEDKADPMEPILEFIASGNQAKVNDLVNEELLLRVGIMLDEMKEEIGVSLFGEDDDEGPREPAEDDDDLDHPVEEPPEEEDCPADDDGEFSELTDDDIEEVREELRADGMKEEEIEEGLGSFIARIGTRMHNRGVDRKNRRIDRKNVKRAKVHARLTKKLSRHTPLARHAYA